MRYLITYSRIGIEGTARMVATLPHCADRRDAWDAVYAIINEPVRIQSFLVHNH